jgi:hypothetical protein
VEVVVVKVIMVHLKPVVAEVELVVIEKQNPL